MGPVLPCCSTAPAPSATARHSHRQEPSEPRSSSSHLRGGGETQRESRGWQGLPGTEDWAVRLRVGRETGAHSHVLPPLPMTPRWEAPTVPPPFFSGYKSNSCSSFPVLFLRQSLTLSPRLECSGLIMAHSAVLTHQAQVILLLQPFQVAGTTSMHRHAWLILVFLVETGFCHIGQAGLKLLTL